MSEIFTLRLIMFGRGTVQIHFLTQPNSDYDSFCPQNQSPHKVKISDVSNCFQNSSLLRFVGRDFLHRTCQTTPTSTSRRDLKHHRGCQKM